MKSQKTLWIAAIAFIMATFVYIGIQHRRINHLSDANQLQAVELSTLNYSVYLHKNKAQELTYKLTSVEIDRGNLKRSLEFAGFDIKELKDRDIAWRKITSALRAQLAATGSGETTVTDTFRIEPARPGHSGGKTDTVYFSKVSDWSNSYLSLFNSKIENSRLTFDYSYKTGISILQTQNRKATIVSVSLTDPNAAIVSGNSITIKHKKKIWERGWLWAAVGFGTGILISR